MPKPNIHELLKATLKRRKADIVLTTGAEFELYYTPLSEARSEKLREIAGQAGGAANTFSLHVLIDRAEYADGEKMFKSSDMGRLRQEYSSEDVARMVVPIINCGGMLVDQDSKSDQESTAG